MKVVVAGGSGALGRRLCDDLAARGHQAVILTRSPRPGVHRQVGWDGQTVGEWAGELAGSAVVNLAGELVDRRPTRANIDLLTRSRVAPTAALAAAAARLDRPVAAWVQASTLAIYGDAGERELTESSPPAAGPPQMAGVATAWERAAEGVDARRQAILRTSIVLDRDTPALTRLARLTKWGLGGRIGTGRQWFSWIHIDDWLSVVRVCLGIEPPGERAIPPEGIVHATAPNPVRNQELMATLRELLHRPWSPPALTPMVHAGALLLRTDPALALTGRRGIPEKLMASGFKFSYPNVHDALGNLLNRG